MKIFKHEIKMNWCFLAVWTGVVAGLNFLFMMMYPQMRDQMNEVTDMFANMGGFSAAFGMDKLDLGTAMGFYGTEAGAMLAVGGGMLASLLGGNMLCKEEGGHTGEFLFTMPISRARIALEKLAAVGALILLFNVICILTGIGAFAAVKEEISWQGFLLYHSAQLLMQLEIGALCFGISAFLKKTSMGLAIGVSLLLYFLLMFANISPDMEWLKFITPYFYSDASKVMADANIETSLVILGGVYGLGAVMLGTWRLGHKDLAA